MVKEKTSQIMNSTLFETFTDTGVDEKLLAPGTSGSFDVYYDTSGTETARNVKITFDASDTDLYTLEYFKFYSDEAKIDDITESVLDGDEGNLLDQDFGPTDAGKGTITVYWEWPFEAGDGEHSRDQIDALDTADGENPISAVLTITLKQPSLMSIIKKKNNHKLT